MAPTLNAVGKKSHRQEKSRWKGDSYNHYNPGTQILLNRLGGSFCGKKMTHNTGP